jgi:cysteinyl-tRNA synthetase
MTNIDPKNILADNKSVNTYTSKQTKFTLKTIEERNPYQFIEKALAQAKDKLDKMKGTKNFIESLTDNEKKKRYLKNENKQLRDQLKAMSDNVNLLIEKMNHEALRKKKMEKDGESVGSTRVRAADQEILNTDKAVQNLLKEHTKLRKRLEEVQNPEFLIDLKKQLKEVEIQI